MADAVKVHKAKLINVVNWVACHPTEPTFLTCSEDGSVFLWVIGIKDIRGTMVCTLKVQVYVCTYSHTQTLISI